MTKPADFIVHLRAEPRGRDRFDRDPVDRLRGALKRLLRSYGLRCMRIETGGSKDGDDA